MSLRMQIKDVLLILLTFIIGAVLLGILYFRFYQPILIQSNTLDSELKLETKQLEIIQKRLEDIHLESIESTVELQRKVPVQPLADQLLLDLEKAEVVSGVHIKEISFTEDALNVEVNSEALDEETDEEIEPEVFLPDGMKQITAALSIDAKDYFEFEDFLAEIETLRRMMKVDQFSVSGPAEMTTSTGEEQVISFQVSVSAFYMPTLLELIDQLPQVNAPAPANKKDPFSRFPDSKEQSNSDN